MTSHSKAKTSSSPSLHSCVHSSYGYSDKDRVLKAINEAEIELSPIQISVMTGVNHTKVRRYVRALLSAGEVLQPYPGAYCNKSVHGVRFVPLRFHNIVLSVSAPWLDFSDELTEITGAVKIRVTFGVCRRRITGCISCDRGMERDALFFALNKFFDVVEGRMGKPVKSVVVKTVEVNRDYVGVRLDSVKCLTKKGLFGALERIYQKEPDIVRHEFKISRPMSLDEFAALVQGSASSYNLQQGLFMLVQKFEGFTEAMKFHNGLLKSIFDWLQKGEVRKLAGDNRHDLEQEDSS